MQGQLMNLKSLCLPRSLSPSGLLHSGSFKSIQVLQEPVLFVGVWLEFYFGFFSPISALYRNLPKTASPFRSTTGPSFGLYSPNIIISRVSDVLKGKTQ